MSYKKVLTIQDISCVGQCSLTVALPILSACGHETCILPSAVLSTHTAGFSQFTFRDLTDDIPAIQQHWQKENIKFDCIYTGYLGSTKQIEYVKDILKTIVIFYFFNNPFYVLNTTFSILNALYIVPHFFILSFRPSVSAWRNLVIRSFVLYITGFLDYARNDKL